MPPSKVVLFKRIYTQVVSTTANIPMLSRPRYAASSTMRKGDLTRKHKQPLFDFTEHKLVVLLNL